MGFEPIEFSSLYQRRVKWVSKYPWILHCFNFEPGTQRKNTAEYELQIARTIPAICSPYSAVFYAVVFAHWVINIKELRLKILLKK